MSFSLASNMALDLINLESAITKLQATIKNRDVEKILSEFTFLMDIDYNMSILTESLFDTMNRRDYCFIQTIINDNPNYNILTISYFFVWYTRELFRHLVLKYKEYNLAWKCMYFRPSRIITGNEAIPYRKKYDRSIPFFEFDPRLTVIKLSMRCLDAYDLNDIFNCRGFMGMSWDYRGMQNIGLRFALCNNNIWNKGGFIWRSRAKASRNFYAICRNNCKIIKHYISEWR